MFKIGFVKRNDLIINLVAHLAGVNPHAVAIAVHGLSHITHITTNGSQITNGSDIGNAEEIDDQEILLVVINKTVLF